MKLKSELFYITIKTPIVAILLITLVFSSLLFIIYYCEIGVYEKYEGVVLDIEGDLLFKINSNTTISKLPKRTAVIWYFSDNDKRYNGEILYFEKQNNTTIIKNTSKLKLNSSTKSLEKVFVELLVGKTKIYKRLFLKNKSSF